MDNVETIWSYFMAYGNYFLFLIVFLEYLNLPGLPAGIIMPAAGVLISRQGDSFPIALFISVIAGLMGSAVLYMIGRFLDIILISRFYARYPKIRPTVDKTMDYIEKYGNKGVFVARLIPVARTIISLVAGTSRLNFLKFLSYSVWGIAIWNFVFIFAGYAFGEVVLP